MQHAPIEETEEGEERAFVPSKFALTHTTSDVSDSTLSALRLRMAKHEIIITN